MKTIENKKRSVEELIKRFVRGLFPKKLREAELKLAVDKYLDAQYWYAEHPSPSNEAAMNDADTEVHFAAMTLAAHIKIKRKSIFL